MYHNRAPIAGCFLSLSVKHKHMYTLAIKEKQNPSLCILSYCVWYMLFLKLCPLNTYESDNLLKKVISIQEWENAKQQLYFSRTLKIVSLSKRFKNFNSWQNIIVTFKS